LSGTQDDWIIGLSDNFATVESITPWPGSFPT
jgi:hypothetical protein